MFAFTILGSLITALNRKTLKITAVTTGIITCGLVIYSCGDFTKGAPYGPGANVSINIKLPPGMIMKQGTINESQRALQITGITCEVKGPGMDDILIPISMETKTGTINNIPPGPDRIFYVTITTYTGKTVTSTSEKYDLSAGENIEVLFDIIIKTTISGLLSESVLNTNLKTGMHTMQAITNMTWQGATIEIIDSTGTVKAIATANDDGSFVIDVMSGENYILRASIGNMVLIYFLETTSGNTEGITVDPRSTAVTMVLAEVIGSSGLGKKDTGGNFEDVSSMLKKLDNVSDTITQIRSDSIIMSIATALAQDIELNYDPSVTGSVLGFFSSAIKNLIRTLAVNTALTARFESRTVTDLNPGTTYYWKVLASDTYGGVTESEVRSFITK